jgi:glycosyltransferase involved in cell wall biosynthesis
MVDGAGAVVHQFHYTAAAGDAVTNQMFFIQRSLAAAGVPGDVLAIERKGIDPSRAAIFSEDHVANSDLLLVHHSHGNPALKRVLSTGARKAGVYHNVTPSEFFRHDPHMERLSRLGRDQLRELVERIPVWFADSDYNARELGVRAELLPLLEIPPISRRAPRRVEAPWRLLFVGKLTPHKDASRLIETLFHLRRSLGADAELVLVGGYDPVYGAYARQLATLLGLERHVRFAGKVSDAARDALYDDATAFVCLSRHEGFCVPLIEAMQLGIPTFALDAGAVRETLDGAGVLIRHDDPFEVARIIAAVLSSPGAVEELVAGQWERLERGAPFFSSRRITDRILPLLGSPRGAPA